MAAIFRGSRLRVVLFSAEAAYLARAKNVLGKEKPDSQSLPSKKEFRYCPPA